MNICMHQLTCDLTQLQYPEPIVLQATVIIQINYSCSVGIDIKTGNNASERRAGENTGRKQGEQDIVSAQT